MLTEMLGKGGNLCSHAKSGEIRCPLIDLLPPDWSIWYESHSRPPGQEDFR